MSTRATVRCRASDSAYNALRAAGFATSSTDGAIIGDGEVLWVGLDRRVGVEVMQAMPSLRYVCCPATGTDHIDRAALESAGVKVLSLTDCREAVRDVPATAELTIWLILSLLRNLPHGAGNLGRDLRGLRVLVVGYGRVGTQVAKLCRAVGAELDVVERADRFRLTDAMSKADVVTVHVDLNETTRGMIGKVQLDAMKCDAVLVNTSRGAVIDEAALAEAIQAGRRVAIDVHANEPGPLCDALTACDGMVNFVHTPHIGGYTSQSRSITDKALVDCLLAHIEAEKIPRGEPGDGVCGRNFGQVDPANSQ